MTAVFALTTHGLEALCAAECSACAACEITEIGYRRIAARLDADLPAAVALGRLLGLRTIDDLFIQVAAWSAIDHRRTALVRFRELAAALRLPNALRTLESIRTIGTPPRFSVTASFVGRRNYTAPEIKAALAQGIIAAYDWIYVEDDRDADLNVRVFIEHDHAYVGIRAGTAPLYRRAYKQQQHAGSLKPTVAAAMLQAAAIPAGSRILDPCCGVGTILIEAALCGFHAIGGDIDPAAVTAARENAGNAAVNSEIQHWDARRLPLPDHSTDHVVSNLPWGGQIPITQAPEQFYADICREIERVLVPGGNATLLVEQPELVGFGTLQLRHRYRISLFGREPTILVFAS